MRIRLRENRPENPEVISFIFDLGGQPFSYIPGQYLYYTLDDLAFPDNRGKQRHFTISSSPTEKGMVMFTTRMRGSGFKETLRHAAPGYELSCGTPMGQFALPPGQGQHVFIAGGIGITPFRSMLCYSADQGNPLQATLFYFNHSESDIIFGEELENMPGRLPGFKLVHVISRPQAGWKGEQGKLDEALLRKYVKDLTGTVFWLSGPPSMVTSYAEILNQTGISQKAIHMDRFVGY